MYTQLICLFWIALLTEIYHRTVYSYKYKVLIAINNNYLIDVNKLLLQPIMLNWTHEQNGRLQSEYIHTYIHNKSYSAQNVRPSPTGPQNGNARIAPVA